MRQRLGAVGPIKVCAQSSARIRALKESADLKATFPGQDFAAYPDVNAPQDRVSPDLYRKLLAEARPRQAVIIATGSNARQLPGAEFDESLILSNDGALRIPAVPGKLGVIGSGVIGLEMGSVWRRLGAEVTILEAMPTFLGAADESVAKEALKVFTKQGLKINVGVKVGEIESSAKGVKVNYTDAAGAAQVLECDKLIVSIGRVPNTIGLNPEAVGLQLDERGAIVVDAECKTNLPGVWAVGDVVRGPMLAHKAEDEGVAVAEIPEIYG